MKKEFFEILKQSSLCLGLMDEQINRLIESNLIKCVRYKRGEIFFWTDHTPDKLIMLLSGNTTMGRDTFDGKRSLSKSNTAPGTLLNEVRLFSSKKLLWEYAIALEDSEVLEISSRLLLEPPAEYSDIQVTMMRNIVGTLVDKINLLGDKVRILSFASVRDRIAFYLFHIRDEQHRIILTQTQEEIADYLGIARPSLSRELGRMQNEGILRITGHEVVVLDQALFDNLYE